MKKTKISRSEELARISQEATELFLEEKLDAQNQRTEHIADLKALRLEQESRHNKAAIKLAKAVNKK